ncbi:MAG: DUF4291 domain-containing protein [Xenococcaceae cyanobacterium]
MRLVTEPYLTQVNRWPKTGRHILAQYDDSCIVVYQAYRPAIGHFAASHSLVPRLRLGMCGEFRLNRMSWIKPNFLWMMYRSGWGTKPGQEVVLAIWLKRSTFEEILGQAVHSHFVPELYSDQREWTQAVKRSSVRVQWDRDRDPNGRKLERRAIQLGLRGEVLSHYANDWIVNIEDISEFVEQQYQYVQAGDWTNLLTSYESVYQVINSEIAKKLRLSVS